MAPYHGTPAMAPSIGTQWHTAMAPRNGTQQWHPMAPYHGTQQWHRTMAPSNGTTSSLSKCVITTPRLLHPAMAPSNGTLSDGTQQWHHVQSANVCNHPPLLLKVRTPIAKAIWGKTHTVIETNKKYKWCTVFTAMDMAIHQDQTCIFLNLVAGTLHLTY